MRFFRKRPIRGGSIREGGFAAGVGMMARALERMTVHNGQVQWLNGIPKIIMDETGPSAEDILPKPTAQYQVVTTLNGTTWVADWVRAASIPE